MPDPFTADEDALLAEFYKKIPLIDLQEKLWGRSESQIIRRAKELHLEEGDMKYLNHYSPVEIQYLKENYETAPWDDILSTLNRKKGSVISKAQKMGLKRKYRYRGGITWEDEDINFLMKNYLNLTATEIEKHLEKSKSAIYHKAKRLGLIKK